ncbi:MAG: electron transfer flavoprotein subunit alpha/FixB family protein [Desulfobacterales bacterium]|nr:electron transfer flavoprotein subunit alpha/FixB family protein [Desulfobacterales bacterium]
MRPRSVVIVAEHDQRGLCAVNQDVVACARGLAASLSVPVSAVVLGDRPEPAAREMAQIFGIDVTAVENPFLKGYCAEVYLQELHALLVEWAPAFVLTGHTGTGCDFAPGLAVGLDAACITAVEDVAYRQGQALFFRGIAGGKLIAGVGASTPTAVITVLPGAFREKVTPEPAMAGEVTVRKGSIGPRHTLALGIQRGEEAASNLAEARVIVSAGNGIGNPENLILVERLAALFGGSAVAGSRPVCDQGWLPYNRQVGVTGKVVAPDVYIACGISGASQHVAGMAGSGLVVAINTDPHAAIFREADIGIVEDLTTFIPVLLEMFNDLK